VRLKVYQYIKNFEYCGFLNCKQSKSAKAITQKGNSPDYLLRFLNIIKVNKAVFVLNTIKR